MTVTEKTQIAYDTLREARQHVKTARGVVRDLVAGNERIQELKAQLKDLRAELQAEQAQLEAAHEPEFTALRDAQADLKDVQLIFDDLYLASRDAHVTSGTQLSLFDPEGTVEVELRTVVKVVRPTALDRALAEEEGEPDGSPSE